MKSIDWNQYSKNFSKRMRKLYVEIGLVCKEYAVVYTLFNLNIS